jgi:hypothetical protein
MSDVKLTPVTEPAVPAEPAPVDPTPVTTKFVTAVSTDKTPPVIKATAMVDSQLRVQMQLADGTLVAGSFVVDENDATTDLNRVMMRTVAMGTDRFFAGEFLVQRGGEPVPGQVRQGSGLLSEALTAGVVDQAAIDALNKTLATITSWLAQKAGFSVP